MSKGFNLNFKNANVMTFEQENDLFAGQSIKLKFQLGECYYDLEVKLIISQQVSLRLDKMLNGLRNVWLKKLTVEETILYGNQDQNKLGPDFRREDMVVQKWELTIMPEFFSLNDIKNLKDQSIIEIRMKK